MKCLCGVRLFNVCTSLTLSNVTVDEIKQAVKKQEQKQGTILITLKTVSYPQVAKKDAESRLLLFCCVSSKRGNVEIASLMFKVNCKLNICAICDSRVSLNVVLLKYTLIKGTRKCAAYTIPFFRSETILQRNNIRTELRTTFR